MLIREYRKKFINRLKEEYSSEEASSFFNLLVKFYLGWERIDLALDPLKVLSSSEEDKLNNALHRLTDHVPIQYIIGETEFFGLKFKVNKNVLIPRPETEELVQWIQGNIKSEGKDSLEILDIGTGSGCIAISLAKIFPTSKVSAMDISEGALKVAEENAKFNETQVDFVQGNVLDLSVLPANYDIIVSNPPYVRELEKSEMQRNVLEHEPSLALYVKDTDPLIFYKKITKLAEEGLHPSGELYFEINQYLGDQTLQIVENAGFKGELRKDIFGNDRMIRAIKRG